MANAYMKEADQKKNLELAEALYNAIKQFLWVKCYDQVPESLMEDVLQNTLIAIFDSLDTYRGNTPQTFEAWCRRIFFFKKSDMWRNRFALRTTILEPDVLIEVLDKSGKITAFQPGERHDLENLISRLKCLKRYCLELLWKKADGMRLVEIGKQMNLSSDAVRMKLKRCKQDAIKCLKRNRT